MIGLYKGHFMLNNIEYYLQYSASTTSQRIDIMTIPRDSSGFYIMLPDAVQVCCSVFLSDGNIYYYGDYELYTKYNAIINSAKYYYFKDDEILKDSVEFDVTGPIREFHSLSKDNNLELYRKEHQGNITEVFYRSGINEIKLSLSKPNTTVKKLSKLEYQLKVYDDSYDISAPRTYRSLNEIATFKNLDWLKDKEDKYKVITTKEDFNNLVAELKDAVIRRKAIGFDTETTGTTFNRFPIGTPGRDKLVGICISHRLGEGYYIPVGHINIPNLDLDYVISELKWILENGWIVTHYGKFDAMVMKTYGVNLNIKDDTYIILYILSNIDSHANLKLKDATKTYLNRDQISLEDIFPGSGDGDTIAFQELPEETVKYYACCDADVTLELYNLLKDRIPKLSKSLYNHEVYFMRVLADMEYNGNRVNIEAMKEEADRCLQDISVLENEIYKLAGYMFNINSIPSLSKLLYEDLKCEVLTKTPEGLPSTGSTALKNLAKRSLDTPINKYSDIVTSYINPSTGKPNVLIKAKTLNNAKYPIIHVILEYKKLVKLYSTFFTGLERDSQQGWIFSSYNQTRAATGRTISNFQQIPKELKHLITEWDDNYYMINLDYASIELRVMVGLAGQTEVIEQFSNPEADPHRIIGSNILKKPAQEITHDERKKMKVANFGVPFDMGPHSLAQFLFGFPVTRENVEYARKLKADYLNSMPKVKRMFKDIRDKAQIKGVVTTKFGRIGVFRNLPKETDPGLIARGRRQAGNLPIQGTAADILKIATNALYTRIKELNLDVYITGAIHDELILIVNRNIHPYTMIRHIKECLELKIKGFPNIYTGIAVSSNWGEGKNEDIRELPVLLAEEMAEMDRQGNLPKYEGHPKEFILNEIRKYLLKRFRDYFVELGLNMENPENSNFYELVTNFKHMYLGPRCVAYYTNFGGYKGEPKLEEAVKLALRDILNYDIEKINELIERDTPKDAVVDINELVFDFDLSELLNTQYEFDDSIEISLEDVEEYTEEAIDNSRESENLFRIFSTYDSLVINLEGVKKNNLITLNNYLNSIHKDDGFLNVIYTYHGSTFITKYRVDSIDRDVALALLLDNEEPCTVNKE